MTADSAQEALCAPLGAQQAQVGTCGYPPQSGGPGDAVGVLIDRGSLPTHETDLRAKLAEEQLRSAALRTHANTLAAELDEAHDEIDRLRNGILGVLSGAGLG